jgi:excisionase family DNA binding protein
METNLKLYSLSDAAEALCIGRDALRSLVAEGKIGCILVGNSKRIPYQELVRFQTEYTVRRVETFSTNKPSEQDLKKMFGTRMSMKSSTFNSRGVLENIIRNDKDGNG